MKKLLIFVFLALFCSTLGAGYMFDGRVIFSKHAVNKDRYGYLIIEKAGGVLDTVAEIDTTGYVYWYFPFGNIIFDGDTIIVRDVSKADSSLWFDDGDTTRITSDNPFDFGNSVTVPIIRANICDTIASAATLVLTNHNNFVITGVADIDSIDQSCIFPDWAIAYIEFTGIAIGNGIMDGKNLKLAGNFVYNADDMIMLQRRGNIFYEISRSAN